MKMTVSQNQTAEPQIVILNYEDGFIAYAPDLPGCMGDGDTKEAAEADCRKAAKEWLDEAKRIGRVQ
jgi:antitoxin HicB